MNDKEKDTVNKMIRIYCRCKHGQKNELCPQCLQLKEYAFARLERCTFGEEKPACKDCSIHCYKKDYRLKIQEVMRFAGPKMLFYYPIDAIKHLWKTIEIK